MVLLTGIRRVVKDRERGLPDEADEVLRVAHGARPGSRDRRLHDIQTRWCGMWVGQLFVM